MKKKFALLLLMVALFMLVGCGSANEEGTGVTLEHAYMTTVDENINESVADSNIVEEYEENLSANWYLAELDAPNTFTHTLSGLGFVAPDDWTVEDQGEGSVFIVASGNSIVINILGAIASNPEWDDPLDSLTMLLNVMLRDQFGGQDIEIQQLSTGEKGHAILIANYTVSFGAEAYPGIGFILFDGERFALLNGVLVMETIDLINSYFDFVASIRFL